MLSISTVAYRLHDPSFFHLALEKRLYRYVKGSLGYGSPLYIGKQINPDSFYGAFDA